MDILEAGKHYSELPDTYVIFICDFDPIGLKKYRYTIRQTLKEDGSFEYVDGSHTLFLSTVGDNESQVSEALVKFLKYVRQPEEFGRAMDVDDEFVMRLQKSVDKVKSDREMKERFMLFEEIKREEYRAGQVKGRWDVIKEFLADCGSVSDELMTRIQKIEDMDVLTALTKKAARVSSIEEFEKELDALNC